MSTRLFFGPDPERSRLRATVSSIEKALHELPSDAVLTKSLQASFSSLVTQLALGPEPELRQCPNCSYFGMRAASVCGHCWTKLVPPASIDN
jgi:hypothetical protein